MILHRHRTKIFPGLQKCYRIFAFAIDVTAFPGTITPTSKARREAQFHDPFSPHRRIPLFLLASGEGDFLCAMTTENQKPSNQRRDCSVESSDLFGYCRHCGDRLFRPESIHCSQTCSDYDKGRDTYTGRPLTRMYSIDQRNERINEHKRFMDAIKLRDLRERNEPNVKRSDDTDD